MGVSRGVAAAISRASSSSCSCCNSTSSPNCCCCCSSCRCRSSGSISSGCCSTDCCNLVGGSAPRSEGKLKRATCPPAWSYLACPSTRKCLGVDRCGLSPSSGSRVNKRRRVGEFGGEDEGEEQRRSAGNNRDFVHEIADCDPTENLVAQGLWLDDQDTGERMMVR